MEILEEYYTDNFKTFNEWFDLIKMNSEVFPSIRIPYQEWVDEYIENIESKNENEVLELLRHLLSPFTCNLDISNYHHLKKLYEDDKNKHMLDNNNINKVILKSFTKIENYKRIQNGQDAWEGLT